MKYIIVIMLILLHFHPNTFSQDYFDNLYNYNDLQEFDSETHLFKGDSNLIVIGSAPYEGPLRGLIIRQIDKSGNLLWEDFLKEDTLGLAPGSTHTSYILKNNLYILGFAQKWSTTEREYQLPFFIEYDILKKEVVQKNFFRVPYSSGIRSIVLKDGFIYGVGNIKLTEEYRDSDGLIMKFDLEANLIWQKSTDYGIGDFLWEIETLDDHLIITGAQIETPYSGRPILIKLDTAGNIIKKIEPDVKGGTGDNNIEIHNKNIYYSVISDERVIQQRTQLLAKYNENLELQWDTLIPITSQYYLTPRRMEILNNQIIIAGNILGAPEFTNNKVWSYAMNWSLDGQFNWEHVYRYDDRFIHHIDDIEALPNGDLVFMGTVFDSVNSTDNFTDQYLWLFRTDSLGCGTVQETCYYTIEEYFADTLTNIIEPQFSTVNLVEILGNPFTTNLQISSINNKPLQLQFYNTAGQLFATEKLSGRLSLNTQNWPSGIYFMQVYENGKLIGVEKLVRR